MKWNMFIFRRLPAAGMALFPFIIIKNKEYSRDYRLIKHEYIHFKQQIELLILPFYLLYLLFFIYYWLKTKDKRRAYLAIPFEREAYAHESEKGYLKYRKAFAWWRYF